MRRPAAAGASKAIPPGAAAGGGRRSAWPNERLSDRSETSSASASPPSAGDIDRRVPGSRRDRYACWAADADLAVVLAPPEGSTDWALDAYLSLGARWKAELAAIAGRPLSFGAITPGDVMDREIRATASGRVAQTQLGPPTQRAKDDGQARMGRPADRSHLRMPRRPETKSPASQGGLRGESCPWASSGSANKPREVCAGEAALRESLSPATLALRGDLKIRTVETWQEKAPRAMGCEAKVRPTAQLAPPVGSGGDLSRRGHVGRRSPAPSGGSQFAAFAKLTCEAHEGSRCDTASNRARGTRQLMAS